MTRRAKDIWARDFFGVRTVFFRTLDVFFVLHHEIRQILQVRTGGRLTRHARYFVLQQAESYLTQRLFGQIFGRIERLAWHPT